MPERKHTVTFLSPGTLFAEQDTKWVDSWDPAIAVKIGADIIQRYGAKPYGFYFSTIITADPVSDGEGGKLSVESKEVSRSGMFFLGGIVESFDEVVARADHKEHIMRSNMKSNRIPLIHISTRSYKHTQYFDQDDVVVDEDTGAVIIYGNNAKYMTYRKQMFEKWDIEDEQPYKDVKTL